MLTCGFVHFTKPHVNMWFCKMYKYVVNKMKIVYLEENCRFKKDQSQILKDLFKKTTTYMLLL